MLPKTMGPRDPWAKVPGLSVEWHHPSITTCLQALFSSCLMIKSFQTLRGERGTISQVICIVHQRQKPIRALLYFLFCFPGKYFSLFQDVKRLSLAWFLLLVALYFREANWWRWTWWRKIQRKLAWPVTCRVINYLPTSLSRSLCNQY